MLGFGSQGRAQALNLRDSGITPLIGLPSKSKSRKKAKDEGLTVVSPEKAIRLSDIIAVLIPDHKHEELLMGIPSQALSGKAFIFAHGLSVAFGLVAFPPDSDVIMVAPHGPGMRLRERYIDGEVFTAFTGIEQDYSGQARRISAAYADAIGCDKSNLFDSTFREEAVGDIFGEQAVLCGGLVGLLESGFDTLVRQGHSPRSAYLECVYQLDLIIDLIKRFGSSGMFERISKTAAFGSLKVKDRLFDKNFKDKLEELYKEIDSGEFARSLTAENKKGFAGYKTLIAKAEKSSLQKTHESIVADISGRLRRLTVHSRMDARKADGRKGSKDI